MTSIEQKVDGAVFGVGRQEQRQPSGGHGLGKLLTRRHRTEATGTGSVLVTTLITDIICLDLCRLFYPPGNLFLCFTDSASY